MKKLVSIIMITIVALAGCVNSDPSTTDTKTDGQEIKPSLRIGYVTILANAPGIVADKKGFFNEKLNVKTYGFDSGPALYQALAAGELDVAYAGVPAMVNWASRGLPVKVIGKVSDGKIGVIAPHDTDLEKVADLKGKVMGSVSRGSGVDIINRALILPEANLSIEDLVIQEYPQGNMEAAIDAGHIAAGVVSEPFVTYALLRGKKLIGEERDPALVLLATDKAVKEKNEAIQLFVEIHQQAIHFLNNNAKDANQVLAEAFNISQVEEYSPSKVVEKAREKMNYDWQFSNEDFEYYQLLADSAYELGYIDQKLNLETLFDLTIIEGVVK